MKTQQAHTDENVRRNLDEFRVNALPSITVFIGVIGYLGLVYLLLPGRSSTELTTWLGVFTLILGPLLSHLLKDHHPMLSIYLIVDATIIALTCIGLAPSSLDTLYLMVIPVILASMLLGPSIFFITSIVVSLLTLGVGMMKADVWMQAARLTTPIDVDELMSTLFPGPILFPTMVVALTALASWLSAENQNTAVAWAFNSYNRALENELAAREHEGELRRTLKALDEATHRLQRANYMLGLARDQAEEARRLKQQFAQTISHELRTPLNLIVGFTELMTESPEHYGSPLPQTYLHDLGIVRRNARHLQDLVNDVLDLARIDIAQMSIVPEKVSPKQLVKAAIHTVKGLIESQGLNLHIDVASDLPDLEVDATRIRQVLINLLSNAARFTNKGSITVEVRQKGGEITFSVTDTGIGIAADDLARIFEEFQQADGSLRRPHSGAGLGLAISKRFVELHGGHIWAESQLRRGSTFRFSLPIEQGHDLKTAKVGKGRASDYASGGESDKALLLMVTQSSSAVTLLSRYVTDCQVTTIPTLDQCCQTARELMPQVIVIDRHYEDLSTEALTTFTKQLDLNRAFIIAMPLPGESLLADPGVIDRYLVKPFSKADLWNILRQFGEDINRILIVDDNRDFVRLLSRLFDNPVRRYEVISAYSAEEGLILMQKNAPDLILADILMPGMDGIEFVNRIRTNSAWETIPIIIVSGQEEIDQRERLEGPVVLTSSNGLLPSEVVHYVQNAVDVALGKPIPLETDLQ